MTRITMFVIVFLLALLPAAAQAQFEPTSPPPVVIGNDKITWSMTWYNTIDTSSTWYYEVESGAQPAISHVTFAVDPCRTVVEAGTWDGKDFINGRTPNGGSPTVGADPTTGLAGVKFDQSFEPGEIRYYYFTVEGWHSSAKNAVATKAGDGFDTGLIEGPEPCDDSLAISLSYYSSQSVDGDVRISWETSTEAGNAGFRLFSGENILRLSDCETELTDAMIPGAMDSVTHRAYSFTAHTSADQFCIVAYDDRGFVTDWRWMDLGRTYGVTAFSKIYVPMAVQ